MAGGSDLLGLLEHLKFTKEVTKDNFTFRLLTQISFGIFISCSLLGGLTTYIKDPIKCHINKGVDIDKDVFEAHCWLHGTRDLSKELSGGCKIAEAYRKNHGNTENQHLYYQWIIFMLVFSAILFKIPGWIWASLEDGLMDVFADHQKKRAHVLGEDESSLRNLARIQAKNFRRIKGRTTFYFAKFMFCQILAIIMVILNFHITDRFLDGQFKTYGYDAYNYTQLNSTDQPNNPNPMCTAFPTRVSCTLTTGGTGSDATTTNGYCILAQNIINEKIYFFLWFWFMMLFGYAACSLFYQILMIAVPKFRSKMILVKFEEWNDIKMNLYELERFLSGCTIGDWFVLMQISKNNHKLFYAKFLHELASTKGNVNSSV